MKGTVIFRWGAPFAGREVDAMKFAADSEAGFQDLVTQGLVDRFEWIVNTTGSEDDMVVVWGDLEKLQKIMASDEMQKTRAQGRYLLQRFRYDFGLAGPLAAEVYGPWAEVLTEFAAA